MRTRAHERRSGGMEIKTVRRRSLTGLIAPARTPPLRRSGRLAVVSSPAHYTEAKTRCAISTVSAATAARRRRYPRTVQCYHTEYRNPTPPPHESSAVPRIYFSFVSVFDFEFFPRLIPKKFFPPSRYRPRVAFVSFRFRYRFRWCFWRLSPGGHVLVVQPRTT